MFIMLINGLYSHFLYGLVSQDEYEFGTRVKGYAPYSRSRHRIVVSMNFFRSLLRLNRSNYYAQAETSLSRGRYFVRAH